MICSTFLEEIAIRLTDLVKRARLDDAVLTAEQLNWDPGDGHWTIGQIFEHMRLAVEPYLPMMAEAIDKAPYGKGQEARFSWFGSMIIKASGPSSNAPAPKKLHPGPGPYDRSSIEKFISDHEGAIELAKLAEDTNLSKTIVRNPFLPVFRMNMADCFEIMTVHAERHLGQIETLMRRSDFPKR